MADFSSSTIDFTTTTTNAILSTSAAGSTDKSCPSAKYLTYPSGHDFMIFVTQQHDYFLYLMIFSCIFYALIVLMSVKLFIDCWKIKEENLRGDIMLCVTCPVILASTCFICIFFPRSVTNMTIFGTSYLFFSFWRAFVVIFRLYGDTAHMSDIMYRSGTRIKLNVIPFCCFICCPTLTPSIRNINIFKGLVFQTFLVGFSVLAVTDIIRTERNCDSTTATRVLSFFDFISTFTSLWASGVFVAASNANLSKYKIAGLFQVIRLMQTTYNLQRFVIQSLSAGTEIFHMIYYDNSHLDEGGLVQLGPRVQADFWNNFLMLLWITLLSALLVFHMRPTNSAFYTMKRIHVVHVDTHGEFPEAPSGRPSVSYSTQSKDSRKVSAAPPPTTNGNGGQTNNGFYMEKA